MSTNKEIGEYLRSFTEREDALRRRAREVDLDLDVVPWNSWQTWIGDPERYLNELRNAVWAAEQDREKTPE